jgi:hypothetical protein
MQVSSRYPNWESRPTPPLSSGPILARDFTLMFIKIITRSHFLYSKRLILLQEQENKNKMLEITCKGSPYEVSNAFPTTNSHITWTSKAK